MAILFNKADDQYVEVAYTLPVTTGTIEFEIYVISLYDYNTLWENSVGADDWEGWIYGTGVVAARDGSRLLTSSAITINDTWRHVAYTWNSTANQTKLYIDGSLVDTDTHDALTAGTTFRLGGLTNSASNFMAKNFRIWNTCRTATEINDNKTATLNGDETGLEIYWKLNETTGATVTDTTANARNGTAYGSYTWTDEVATALVSIETAEVAILPTSSNTQIIHEVVETVIKPTDNTLLISSIVTEVVIKELMITKRRRFVQFI